MSERVSISIRDGIADVRMTRADKRNALDVAMFEALADAGAEVGRRGDVRVVVLSGEGSSFCAGLDLTAMAALAATAPGESSPLGQTDGRITHLAQHACWVWQEVPVPVIAALHGHALGGGMQLALAADIRIVHPDTKLSVRETYWGLIPDMTGTLTLTRLVGADVAKELVFTARIFDGREAAARGLATHLSEQPLDEALALAGTIAERSPEAMRGVKELFNGLLYGTAADAFAAERRVIGRLVGGDNQREAVAAHFEQRPPRFTDLATVQR